VDDSSWQRVVAGAWAYQLPAEPEGPWPIPVWYRVPFYVDDVPTRLALLVDGFAGSEHHVWLNGAEISAEPVRSSVDAQIKELDLTGAVRRGRNLLAIRLVVERPTGGLVDYVKLVGSFTLARDGATGYRIAPSAPGAFHPQSWTEQGYPFYSGVGTYGSSIDVSSDFVGSRVFLEVPMRDDVLEVEVNGRGAGVRLWDPYVVEVTELIRVGSNEFRLRVANTPANLLNGHERPSGLAGTPRLVPYAAFELDLTSATPGEGR